MNKLILASTSPRRIEMLKWFNIPFEIKGSKFDEKSVRDKDPVTLVKRLAKAKSESVSKYYSEGIIIGSDTVISLNNHIIEKPSDVADQRRLIELQNGRQTTIISAIHMTDITNKKSLIGVKKTKFKMRELTSSEIEAYIKTGKGLDKGGGFGIQDEEGLFIDSILGCYTNSIGFPLCLLESMFKKIGVSSDFKIKEIVKEKTGYKC